MMSWLVVAVVVAVVGVDLVVALTDADLVADLVVATGADLLVVHTSWLGLMIS